jgi:hypothetical protein
MIMLPLYARFCPERWRKAVDVMLEKIPGVIQTNKLGIIQILEADLNQLLCSAFARNISKLAQEKDGIISEHQYGRPHRTCISPILNKLLTIQILIQKRNNGIVFDNDAKGCYDQIISGIALLSIRHLGYFKNSVKMLGKLWEQLEHHISTGFGVRYIVHQHSGGTIVRHRTSKLFIANYVGNLEPADTNSSRRDIRVYHFGLS